MSWIKNISRFAPFSNQMGTHVWIPYTEVIAKIFPTRIELDGEVIEFDLHGPIEAFTVFCDAEQGKVRAHIRTAEGFTTWYLYKEDEELHLELRKGPAAGVRYRMEGRFKTLKPRESLVFPLKKGFQNESSLERLSFGCSKKQEIKGIYERKDIEEFLPLIFFLSQMALGKVKEIQGGIGDLLKELDQAHLEKDRQGVTHLFEKIFTLGFFDLMTPTLEDLYFQRLVKTEVKKGFSPFHLFPHLYSRIRRCFLEEEGKKLHILPCLPTKTVAGRLTDLEQGSLKIDLEWRKEEVRRMSIETSKKETLELVFPKEMKSYRIRRHLRDRGERVDTGEPLILDPNVRYYLDCFMK